MGSGQGFNLFGEHIDGAITSLQSPGNQEKRLSANDMALLFVERWIDDDIGKTKLIFHQQEGDALGGAWSLATDNETGDADAHAIWQGREIDGGGD